MTLKKISTTLFIISLLLGAGLALAAEEDSTLETTTVSEDLLLDETITAEDLGVGEPNLLPDHPFYIFKEIGRGLQSFFTFNKLKKIELKEKFANEKIIEIRLMVEKKASKDRIDTALRNYQKEFRDMKKIATEIEEDQDKADEETKEKIGKFLDKFIKKQFLHRRIIEKLESQVPEDVVAKIREIKERQLENFGYVMIKLEEKNTEKIQKRLEKNLKEIEGSDFQGFKNLEVLGELINKVPEEAKDAIRRARESTLDILKDKLKSLPVQQREKFKDYVENISGDKEKHLEILESLKKELPEIKELFLDSRVRIIDRVIKQVQEECREIKKPSSNFCVNGRIIIEREDNGCIEEFKCITTAETNTIRSAVCTYLWDPICGTNNKTYSNGCWAKVAGVEINHEGKCIEQEKELEVNVGQFCGGFTGIICPSGLVCDYDGDYPDAGGKCKIEESKDDDEKVEAGTNLLQKRLVEPIKRLISPTTAPTSDLTEQ